MLRHLKCRLRAAKGLVPRELQGKEPLWGRSKLRNALLESPTGTGKTSPSRVALGVWFRVALVHVSEARV